MHSAAALITLVALAGCTNGFETGGANTPPSVSGCADATREAYSTAEPDIAACAGGFEIAGIVASASRSPQCERAAGNDGANANGAGCSIADLCAEGWHVCMSASEVASKASSGSCPAPVAAMFWATRQAEDLAGACAGQGSNNLVGCAEAGIGEPAPPSCVPLTTELRWTHCDALGWSCGGTSEANSEAEVVSKPRPSGGGALCCRD